MTTLKNIFKIHYDLEDTNVSVSSISGLIFNQKRTQLIPYYDSISSY